jgi:histidinol-phosphate aminotransferase
MAVSLETNSSEGGFGVNTMKLPKMYASDVAKLPIDMTLSENPLGCSPRVLEALKTITNQDIFDYPNTTSLFKAIANKFNVDKNQILLGNGSEQLIKLIAQTFLNKRDRVLIQAGSFPLFAKESLIAGGTVSFFNPLWSTTQSATLIILCNPNNPTGEVLQNGIIQKLSKQFPKSLIVVDEANGEFLRESSMNLNLPNVIVLRTLSKVFGLAGLRIGFAVGPGKLINTLKNVQQVFPVSSISSKLAKAALNDPTFLQQTLRFVAKERTFLTKELQNRNFLVCPSITSNIFIQTTQAKNIIELLRKNGVSVVDGAFFPAIDRPGFRIAIRDVKTNRLFLKKLDRVLACLVNKKLLRSTI